ncbi:MAG TPA: hypothetical protein DCZ06_03490, partial [Alphaproteobacteria bacterium]|nr:hypothetical protein [Alphaproteobacteria bacterium]
MPVELQHILPQSRITAMEKSGEWPNFMATELLDSVAAKSPDAVAITGFNSMRGQRETITFERLRAMVNR